MTAKKQGILFRGGLTIADIFHNKSGTVFGQVLIETYLLESKYAKYRRIILSDKLIKKLNYPLKNKRNRYPYHQYINRCDDDCVGIHQMIYYEVVQSVPEITQEKLTEILEKIKKVIIAGLDLSFKKTQVFEKYKWLMNQYEKLVINKRNAKGKLKPELHNIKGADSEQNIHFSYIDELMQGEYTKINSVPKNSNN